MAETPSTMLDLGTPAPDFRLPDTEGRIVSRADFRDAKALLVMFICNHCPFVKHVRHELARVGKEYQARDVAIVGISSNDAVAYPADGPDAMREEKEQIGYTSPYLYDETQEVAKAYGAACTPDFFLYGPEGRLAYRGQLDDSRPSGEKPVTGKDLRAALDAVLEDRPVDPEQRPSLGCNIKWKRGNAPDYFG